MTVLLVAVGGALGAALRFLAARAGDRGFPAGTLAVNLLGSAGLGLLVATAPSAPVLALLGTGVCGGLTTYSALAVGTVERGWAGGAAYAVVSLAGAVAACALGYGLGVLLT